MLFHAQSNLHQDSHGLNFFLMVLKGRKLFRAIRVEDTVSISEHLQDYELIQKSFEAIDLRTDEYSMVSPFFTSKYLKLRQYIESAYDQKREPFDFFNPRCVQGVDTFLYHFELL